MNQLFTENGKQHKTIFIKKRKKKCTLNTNTVSVLKCGEEMEKLYIMQN